jgi:hypothetical protein
MLIFPFRKQHFEEGLRSCSPLFIKMGCGLRVPQPYAAQPKSGMQSKARLLPVDERYVDITQPLESPQQLHRRALR